MLEADFFFASGVKGRERLIDVELLCCVLAEHIEQDQSRQLASTRNPV